MVLCISNSFFFFQYDMISKNASSECEEMMDLEGLANTDEVRSHSLPYATLFSYGDNAYLLKIHCFCPFAHYSIP